MEKWRERERKGKREGMNDFIRNKIIRKWKEDRYWKRRKRKERKKEFKNRRENFIKRRERWEIEKMLWMDN